MSAFDELQRMSFSGIPFPIKTCRSSCAIRDHVHEYPHVPGGAPEKLGRKLYEFHVEAIFDQRLLNPLWKQLWPTDLANLRALWEDEVTADLHVPSIGTIKAYCTNWEQTMDARIRSGESVSLTFREDQSSGFLVLESVSVTSVANAVSAFDAAVAQVDLSEESAGFFDAISNAANSILAVKDQVDVFGSLVESKLLAAAQLLRAADQQVKELNDPDYYPLLEALQDLHLAMVELNEDLAATGARLQTFVTPVTMTVGDLATRLLGSADLGGDILQLNGFDNPFAVPPGTQVRYYAAVDRAA